MEEVKVTNRNTATFRDAYQGIEYIFEPGKPIAIPLAAAVHLFGFGLKDKTLALRRFGFTSGEVGQKWLSAFDLEYVEYIRKDDADEIEALKLAVSEQQALIDELNLQLEAAQTELGQLKDKKRKG
jgi:hypothetical protein